MSRHRRPRRQRDVGTAADPRSKSNPAQPARLAGAEASTKPDAPAPTVAGARSARWASAARWQASAALLLAAVFVGGWVQPVLRYHQAATPFFLEARSFWPVLKTPGGLSRYAADFLVQLDWSNFAGALTTLGLLSGVWWVSDRLFRRLTGGIGPVPLVAVFLMTAGYGRYTWPAEQVGLGLLMAAGAAWAWNALPACAAWVRLAGFWALSGAIFWVGGPAPLMLLALLGAVGEGTFHRRFGSALGCALVALMIPAWSRWTPGFDPLPTVSGGEGGWSLALEAGAYLVLPLGLCASALWRRTGWFTAPPIPARGPVVRRARPLVWRMLGWGGGVALVWASWDTQLKASIQVDRFACEEQWGRALVAATHLRRFTETANLQIARALFHVGRLAEDLFWFPQQRDRDLLPDYRYGMAMCRAEAQTLLELGQVNLAAHFAHEALEFDGPRPETLLLLTRIYVLKDQPTAARLFLRRLRLMPFHQAEADEWLRALAADPKAALSPELAAIRTRMPHTDAPSRDCRRQCCCGRPWRPIPTTGWRSSISWRITCWRCVWIF